MVLTPKQKRVLDFIEGFFKEEGLMPSRREIAEGLGLSSVATVQQHVEALEKQGYLKRGIEGGARDVSIQQRSKDPEEPAVPSVPLLGRVAAGFPIEVFAQQKNLEIPLSLFGVSPRATAKTAHFALQVQGESMRDNGILDGDFVILEKKATARSGETVVALLNGEATLKRYVRGKAENELHPANPKFPVIRIHEGDRFEIQGILRGVIRTYGNR